MEDPKRYTVPSDSSSINLVVQHPNGCFVMWDDYQVLKTRVKELEWALDHRTKQVSEQSQTLKEISEKAAGGQK